MINGLLMEHAVGAMRQQLRRIPPDFSDVTPAPAGNALIFSVRYGPVDYVITRMSTGPGTVHLVERVWNAVMDLERCAQVIVDARDGIRDLVDP